MKPRLSKLLVALTAILALTAALALTTAQAQGSITPSEARTIAKEVYVYGFPVVDNYRVQYAYFVDRENPEYKAPSFVLPEDSN